MNDRDDPLMDEELTPREETAAPEELLRQRDEEIATLKDRLLRQTAETENVRRRLEREKADASAYAVTGFARDLLAVADNLRRALDAIPASARSDPTVSAIVTGVEMTEKELQNLLARYGIQRVDAVGARLDPNLHQAMLEVESHEHEPGTVVQELQAGYTIKDRLLRPALVSVAKAPQPAEATTDG